MRKLVDDTSKPNGQEAAKRVVSLPRHLSIQKELVDDQNKGFREALSIKKKHKDKGHTYDLQRRELFHSNGTY